MKFPPLLVGHCQFEFNFFYACFEAKKPMGHSAAKPQPKAITPSLPSPLPVESLRVEREGEGLPCGVLKVTPQGKGGGDFFGLIKFKDFTKQ